MLPIFRLPSVSPFFRYLLALVATALALAAQSVRWDPPSGTLAREQISTLTLVFEDCEPAAAPVLPDVPGLRFEPTPARGEQTSLNISGTQTIRRKTVTYAYRVRPVQTAGEVRIPAFAIETDEGKIVVPAAGYNIGAATLGDSGRTLDQVANLRFTPPAASIWAGEVFPLTLVLDVDRAYATNNILGAQLDWTPTPFVAEEWGKPQGTETREGGQARFLVTFETRAAAPATAGAIALPTATQAINLPTRGGYPFSMMGPMFDTFTLTSQPAIVQVKALPTPRPADFLGAVGQFKLESKIVPEKAAVGEPITWTLTLSGTGNWHAIDRLPPRALPKSFRVVSPRAEKTPVNNALFDASLSEDLVLIPQTPGRYTLGPYTLSVFNPITGGYETLRTEPVTIDIQPAVGNAGLQPAPQNPASAAPGSDLTNSASAPPPPAPVAKLPAEPLASGPRGAAPLGDWPRLLLWALPLAALPLVLWLVLAARHARRNDPWNARREAHARLRRLLASIESANTPAAADLLAWQEATRELFRLKTLTPTARDLSDAAWSALWLEAERALYRPASALPADWHAQAREALARATPPSRSFFALLRPAHLFPAALAVALVALASPTTGRAADPAADYAAGSFVSAEKGWREALAAAPLDVAARHNLALALAQQGRWGEAAAQAYAAHLQAPADADVRRTLDATRAKAAYLLALPPGAAALLSPRGWQIAALLGAFALLAVAPACLIASRYSPAARRRLALAGWTAALLALTAIAGASLALRAYGPSAEPDAVLVWRDATLRAVPTDAGDQKVTADLPAGTVARVDKSFLGWRLLVLPDGNTGWVRAEALVGLWRAP